MSEGNAVSKFIKKYQETIPNPLANAALISLATIPASYLIRKPFYKFLRRKVRDPRVSKLLFGTTPREALLGVMLMQQTWLGRHGIPILLGSALPLTFLGLNTVPDAPFFGWTKWNPKVDRNTGNNKLIQIPKDTTNQQPKVPETPPQNMKKQEMLLKTAYLFQLYGYQPQLDLTKAVNRNQAISLINNNPFLNLQDAYARHLGTSIITAAPFTGNQITLGGVYDSAVNKFDNKLLFQGIGDKVVKGVVSGALAGMFTDVVGTVLGMPSDMSSNLANTVGVGKALYSILT